MALSAQELRIGNLIQWKSTGDIEIVTDIVTTNKKQCCINTVLISDCSGIPLTKEWLLKAGFKITFNRNSQTTYYELCLNPRMIIRFQDGDAGECDITQDGRFIAFKQGHIKYVHQLQNLYFALSGKELSIK
jgi:hypothetical protein